MIPCPDCNRHIAVGASACPFCDHAPSTGLLPEAGSAAHTALQVVGGAVTTLVLAACYGGWDIKDATPYPTGDTGDTSGLTTSGSTTDSTPFVTPTTSADTGSSPTDSGQTTSGGSGSVTTTDSTPDTGTTTTYGGSGGSGSSTTYTTYTGYYGGSGYTQ